MMAMMAQMASMGSMPANDDDEEDEVEPKKDRAAMLFQEEFGGHCWFGGVAFQIYSSFVGVVVGGL